MKKRMYETMKNAILSHKRWKGRDIYAAMVLVEWDVMGDVLNILINCNRDQFENMGPLNLEERWDYSHWGERNEINIVPDLISDMDIVKWLYEMGVDHAGEEMAGTKLVQGGKEVMEMLGDVVSMLLEDADITGRIGQKTPILIQEMECFEPYASLNIQLNESKNLKSYRRWIEQIGVLPKKKKEK